MNTAIARVDIRYEQDVVYARQRARLIAELLGFDRGDQTRISTAISEIARNAFQYAGGGEVEFALQDSRGDAARASASVPLFMITLRDHGPGLADAAAVLEGRYVSRTGMGLGLLGARRLMDEFKLETAPGQGTTVRLGMKLPDLTPPETALALARIAKGLARSVPDTPWQEIQLQNQELLRALAQLREQQQELVRINAELEDTNRGVIALYAELENKNKQLGHANQVKTRFLSHMSHEFRSPLNSMLAITRLLLDRVDGELAPEQEKQVSLIRGAASDVAKMVDDLLDLARIESGKVAVTARDCLVADIFSGLRGMFKPLAVAPDVRLVIEAPQGIGPLFTDEGKVSQILRNFLSNAFKFTRHGDIRVSARLSADASAVVFEVSDSGIGIAPEDQARIFDEYVQVENAQGGKAKGTGLGLAICRKLARLLGGEVALESRPGSGSTFSATIPLHYADGNAPALERVENRADTTRLPVLLVDDDTEIQVLYETFLQNSPFQAISAYSTAQAKQILEQVPQFASIVLDILLPGESGLQLLAELKQQPNTRNIPVLVASVLDESSQALALGAARYQMKPMTRELLLDHLQELVRGTPQPQALLIDDEEVARYILKDYLAGTKFTVLEAASGQAGLQMARTQKPAVIFLDLRMPDMNGFEVLHQLKQDSALRDIPVIISTSKILDDATRRSLASQAVAILPKDPPNRQAAVDALRLALNQALAVTNKPEGENVGHETTHS